MFVRLKNNLGFSLLELVLCLAMLGILGYIASPIIGNSNTAMSLDAAARQIEGDLRYAQNMATTTGTRYGLKADSTTQYTVYSETGGVESTTTSPYNHQAMIINMTTGFPNTTMGSATYKVEFDSTGQPIDPVTNVALASGTTQTIQLNSTNGTSKSIVVTAPTGNINCTNCQ